MEFNVSVKGKTYRKDLVIELKQIKLKALNGVEVNDKIYFVNADYNMLYAVDKKGGPIEIIGRIPEEKLFGKYLFGNIAECCGKLFLAPLYASKIWIYDLNQRIWWSIELPDNLELLESKFFGAISYGEKVYFLGHKYPGIAVINAKNFEVKYKMASKTTQKCDYLNDGYLNWDYVIMESCIYTPILCRNAILKIDLKNDQMEEIVIGDIDCKFVGLVFDGKCFWLAPRKGRKFVRWDGEDNTETYYLPKCYEGNKYYFGGSFCMNNEVVFTSYEGMTYRFQISHPEGYIIENTKIIFYTKISANQFVVQNSDGSTFVIGEEVEEIDCSISDDDLKDYINKNIFMCGGDILEESEAISLNGFIQFLSGNNKYKKKEIIGSTKISEYKMV